LLESSLFHAALAAEESTSEIVEVTDELERSVLTICATLKKKHQDLGYDGQKPSMVFRQLILWTNNSGYLERKLTEDPLWLLSFEEPPLRVALDVPSAEQWSIEVIWVLLEHVQDPNERSDLHSELSP